MPAPRPGSPRPSWHRGAGTAQSAIAAYESGQRQPTVPTLYRLLAAAGFDLRARLTPHDTHDETLAAWEASLPEPERGGGGPSSPISAALRPPGRAPGGGERLGRLLADGSPCAEPVAEAGHAARRTDGLRRPPSTAGGRDVTAPPYT